MLATELWTMTRNDWQVYPATAYQTRADGTVCHKTVGSAAEFHQVFVDDFAEVPEKVLAGTPGGAFIRNPRYQGRLLQYFARAGPDIEMGVAFSLEDFQIEYWYNPSWDPRGAFIGIRACIAESVV
jgi:hypothetical protein